MKFIILLFLLPVQLFSQDLSGVWVGTIATSGTQIPMELVINQDLTGYSMIKFAYKGSENVAIKTTTLVRKDSFYTMSDDKLIYNNFTTPSRKVKAYCELSIKIVDSVIVLSGAFHTRTRDLRAGDQDLVMGTITLKKQNYQARTQLISKLDSLKLLNTVTFSNPAPVPKDDPVVSAAQEKDLPFAKVKSPIDSENMPKASINLPNSNLKTVDKENVVAEVQEKDLAAVKVRPIRSEPTEKKAYSFAPNKVKSRGANDILKVTSPIVSASAPPPVSKPNVETTKNIPVADAFPAAGGSNLLSKKMDTAVVSPETTISHAAVFSATPVITETQKTVISAPAPSTEQRIDVAAADFTLRKTEVIRSIDLQTDSLVLILYDNGIVDGDTVSVLLNGKVIIPRQGLSENAYRKVVKLTPDLGDSLQLVMYAENLGSIPPNTGLLILEDGPDRQEVRFEGDMKKSSAVILRRKR